MTSRNLKVRRSPSATATMMRTSRRAPRRTARSPGKRGRGAPNAESENLARIIKEEWRNAKEAKKEWRVPEGVPRGVSGVLGRAE